MSKRLQVELNIARLSASGARIDGAIPLVHFKRFIEYVGREQSGDLGATLEFGRSRAAGIPLLDGRMETRVELECHRCGAAMVERVDAEFHYAFVSDESEMDEVDSRYEAVQLDASEVMRSVDLLEDELILQMPLSPRHREVEDCIDVESFGDTQENFDERGDQALPDNPFAVLEKLKKS